MAVRNIGGDANNKRVRMIRRIVDFRNPDDIKMLLGIVTRFLEEAGVECNSDHIVSQVSAIEAAGIGAFWVYEDEHNSPRGMVGAIIAPSVYDAEVEATELFWYVDKPFRNGSIGIRLFQTVERWAKDVGAKRLRFAALEAIKGAEELYERLGMKRCEVYYSKEL